MKRALLLSTPGQKAQAETLAREAGDTIAAVFAGARMHTPVEVTEAAMAVVRDKAIDGTIAIGGGSTTGLGKAIALRTGLDQIVVPTTYAGSEMTAILGETEGGEKKTIRDREGVARNRHLRCRADAHAPGRPVRHVGIQRHRPRRRGLYARDGNPVLALMAEEGIRALAASFPRIAANPKDLDGRSEALYGAWLCGTVLAGTEMALHHKLCHVLGGSFDLPHAETHCVILPHAVAFNAPAVPDAMARVARALGSNDPAARLFDLAREAGAPMALRDIGMPESGLDRAADLAVANPYWNPRPFSRADIRALLDAAWHGRRPGT